MVASSLKDDRDMRNSEVFSSPLDPMAIFALKLAQAESQEINDPNAMALATVDAQGRITQRMVLLKDFHPCQGFYFYTNLNSAKAKALQENHQAALLFHWKSLRCQVRIEGKVQIVSDARADAYFASRARASQIGAWASQQSDILASRAVLEARIQELAVKYEGHDVPRPANWSGYLFVPNYIELWQDGMDRLHDRFAFTCIGRGDGAHEHKEFLWQYVRLYP